MMNRTTRAMAALAIAVLTMTAVGGLASPASAQTDPGAGSKAQSALLQKIDARLGQLQKLGTQVDGAAALTPDHATALRAVLAEHEAGLTALRADVASTTELTQLAKDAKSMVEDHRVYLVLTPQVHLVIAHDAGARAIDLATTKVEPKLSAAIAKAEAAGKDVTQAKADRDAFTAAVSAASTALDGVDTTALALQPKDYPGNRSTIEGARNQVKQARDDLRAARDAAKKVVDDLKALR